jgi:NAD-dependent deacetylase
MPAYYRGDGRTAPADLIRERQPCVVLTGAGVSTESGIPDFRSPTGIWAQYDPMEYATVEAFRRDPVKVWDFYGKRIHMLREAEPNAAHHALAELEREGWSEAVVTQNIDRLHERAGSRSLVEVHGSYRTSSCQPAEPWCRSTTSSPSSTRACAALPSLSATLKPDVVLFGELMPEAEIERLRARARGVAAPRRRLVARVYPVAALPQEALSHGGANRDHQQGPTPYDAEPGSVLAASAGECWPRSRSCCDESGVRRRSSWARVRRLGGGRCAGGEEATASAMLEAGRRFGLEDFPTTSWDARRGYVFAPAPGLSPASCA